MLKAVLSPIDSVLFPPDNISTPPRCSGLKRGNMGKFGEKWGLMLIALAITVPLIGIKIGLHYLGWEFLSIGTLTSSLVAGVFFVIAMILAGVMSDFKEAEKILGELASSIENLCIEARLIGSPEEVADMRGHCRELVHVCIENFKRRKVWKMHEVESVLEKLEEDVRRFNAEGKNVSILTRLRNELSSIRKMSSRIEVIKETTFLPAAHSVAEVGVVIIVGVLLISKIDPFYGGLLLLGVLALVLTAVMLLINDMDNPFEGFTRLDLRVIEKLDRYLDQV
jgi:hypothetical protein